MLTDVLLRRLEDEQAQLAKDALTRPAQRDSFEYGRMCGMYAGMERIKGILIDMVDEQDAREREL